METTERLYTLTVRKNRREFVYLIMALNMQDALNRYMANQLPVMAQPDSIRIDALYNDTRGSIIIAEYETED
jgi:hypothetical protein